MIKKLQSCPLQRGYFHKEAIRSTVSSDCSWRLFTYRAGPSVHSF